MRQKAKANEEQMQLQIDALKEELTKLSDSTGATGEEVDKLQARVGVSRKRAGTGRARRTAEQA